MRFIDTIFVHCTATKPDWMAGSTTRERVDEITRWHVELSGWSDNGYHYLIDRDGTVLGGRDLDDDGDFIEHQGAHASGHNATSIGIALMGGHGSNENDQFKDHYTNEQYLALDELITKLMRDIPTITKIRGHNEVAAKACPGFRVYDLPLGVPASTPNVDNVDSVAPPASIPHELDHRPGTLAVGVFTVIGALLLWLTNAIFGG